MIAKISQIILATSSPGHRAIRGPGAPRIDRIDHDSLQALSILRRLLRIKNYEIAKVLGKSTPWISRVLRGERGIKGGATTILKALQLVYCQRYRQRFGNHLRPPRASDLVFDPSKAHPNIDQLDHLVIINPGRLKLSKYLTSQPVVHPLSTSARIHGMVFYGCVDPSMKEEMISRWRSLGYRVARNNNWKVSVGGQGPFYFGAIPTEDNNIRYRYDATLQIKGEAFDIDPAGGEARRIFQTFLGPWVEEDSLSLSEVHLAFDLKGDHAALLPYRRTWFPTRQRTGFDRDENPLKWGYSWHSYEPGMVVLQHALGPDGKSLNGYDKAAEQRNRLLPSAMPAISDPCCRMESRNNPSKFGKGEGLNPQLFDDGPNFCEHYGWVDLASMDPWDSWLPVFLLAKVSTIERLSLRLTREERSALRRALLAREMKPSLGDLYDAYRSQFQRVYDTIVTR